MTDLAQRDAEILRLKREGLSDAEIAVRLAAEWPDRMSRHIVHNVVRDARKHGKTPSANPALPGSTLPPGEGYACVLDGEVLAPELSGKAAPETREAFAAAIRRAWQTSVDAIFETGRLIAAAKARLAHGEFLTLTQDELPFGARTAQRLMAIAADAWITNATHASHLPPSWMTLYEISRLDDATRDARLADGTINPDMQRRDIAQVRKRQARATREEVLSWTIKALPEQRYGVILADPEWDYAPRNRWTGSDRHPSNHYPTSSLIDIQRRGVGGVAADDCILFLWATVPMLPEAFCVLDAWGFASFVRDPETGFLAIDRERCEYVSSAAWMKYKPGQGLGMGHWFRVDHEILLVATRGKPVAAPEGQQYRSVFDLPASRVHSQKPEIVHEMIEAFWPNLPKIELNRRGPPRPGWEAWGNEALTASELGAPAGGPDGGEPVQAQDETTMSRSPVAPAAPTTGGRSASSVAPPAFLLRENGGLE